MKKTITAFLILALAACKSSTSSSSSSGSQELAFITNGVSSFWEIAEAGAEKAGKDLGAKSTVLMPKDVNEQKQMIEDLLIRGCGGMAVSPIDPTNQTEVLNKAAAATKLITADSDAPDSKRLCYLGLDNYQAGRMAGKLVKEAMPQGGSVALYVGRTEQDNAKRRRQGIIDELLDRSNDSTRFDPTGPLIDGGKYKIIGTYIDQFDRARAKDLVTDTITRTPDVGCMVGLFSYNTPMIVEALARVNKIGQVKVVGFDEEEPTLRGILDGSIHGTVVQNPYEYGYQSIALLKKLAEGDTSAIPASGFIDIPARALRKENVAEFDADLKAKMKK